MFRKTELMFSSPENLKSPAWNTGQKKIRKIAPKHVQNMFGLFWERFLALLEFWNFFGFFRKFSKARPSMEHWAKLFFRKTCPKTCSKQVWTILWTILGLFGFLKFFDDSNFHGTLGKIFFRKKCPKTRLDTWERFWTVLEIWNLLDLFLEFFLSIYLEI